MWHRRLRIWFAWLWESTMITQVVLCGSASADDTVMRYQRATI
jgi:hypothetical protein